MKATHLLAVMTAVVIASTTQAAQLSLIHPSFETPKVSDFPLVDPDFPVIPFFAPPWQETGPVSNLSGNNIQADAGIFVNVDGPDNISNADGDQLAFMISVIRDEPISLFQLSSDTYQAGGKYSFTLGVSKSSSQIAPLPDDAQLALQLFYEDDNDEHQVLAQEIIDGIDVDILQLEDFMVMTDVDPNSDAVGRNIGVKILPLAPLSSNLPGSWVFDIARLDGPAADNDSGPPVAVVPEPAMTACLVPLVALAAGARRRKTRA